MSRIILPFKYRASIKLEEYFCARQGRVDTETPRFESVSEVGERERERATEAFGGYIEEWRPGECM